MRNYAHAQAAQLRARTSCATMCTHKLRNYAHALCTHKLRNYAHAQAWLVVQTPFSCYVTILSVDDLLIQVRSGRNVNNSEARRTFQQKINVHFISLESSLY